MTLQTRLALVVTFVTLASLTVSFTLVLLLVRHDEIEDLDRALARQAARALARHADELAEDGWVDIPEILGGVARHIAVYRADGSLEHATQSFEGDAPRFDELAVSLPLPAEGVLLNSDIHHESLRGILLQIPNSDRIMLYAVSRRAIEHDTMFLYRTLGLLLVAATVCVVLAARWLGQRLVGDVAALAEVARQVGRGELQARAGQNFATSEVRELADTLDSMVARLEALISSQKRFVAHAAHELRSPLSTLRGELQLALRRPREGEAYRAALEEALIDVEALVTLSEDLLLLARVQAGGQRQPRCELHAVITGAVEQAQRRAKHSGVRVQWTNEGGGPYRVAARAEDLTRALRNLLDNAIRHSRAGGIVRVQQHHDTHHAYVAVSDDGPGVPAPDRPRIFEPFFRSVVATEQEAGGTGLGLTIAREIVEALDGRLELDASVERGARFVVSLPLCPEPPRADARGGGAAPGSSAAPPEPKLARDAQCGTS